MQLNNAIQRVLTLSTVLILVAAPASKLSAQTPAKPNILFILADDMGFSDIASYGGEIETPNLDRLAKGGVRFRTFYNQSKCEPSRTAILSGAYNQTNGGRTSLNTALRNGGYFTAFIGKIHGYTAIGTTDRRYTMNGGADNHWNPGPARPGEPQPARKETTIDSSNSGGANGWTIDGVTYAKGAYTFPADFYSTDTFASKAVEYLGAVPPNKPFFCYLSFTAPHWPLHAPPEVIAKYRGRYLRGWDVLRQERLDRQVQLGLFPAGTRLSPRQPEIPAWDSLSTQQQDHYDLLMAIHAAMVDRMDQAIGRVLSKIEEMGRMENTLVVFLSDNGADTADYANTTLPVSDANPIGSLSTYYGFGPWFNLSNTPFRRAKTESHQGGIATPAIISWPAGVASSLRGKWVDELAHVIDFGPTFLEAAGLSIPTSYEGKSLLDTLSARPRSNAPPYLAFQNYATKGIIQGSWKLVSMEARNWELYNLAVDPAELNDLADSERARVAEMESLWNSWASTRSLFPGRSYDGGSSGARPQPGGPPATTAVRPTGFDLSWPAATDADSTSLRYQAWATLRLDAQSPADFRTHGVPIGTLGTSRTASTNALSPGLTYRVTVLVQDTTGVVGDSTENPNIAAYPPINVSLPHVGTPPVPGGVPSLLRRQPSTADLTWSGASDAETPASLLSYRVLKMHGRSPEDIADLLANGAAVTDFARASLQASSTLLGGGLTTFSILVRDGDGNQTLYPEVAARFAGNASSFPEWCENFAVTGESSDDDGEGRPNLLEYATGGDPTLPDAGDPTVSLADANLLLSFLRLRPELSYRVETSTDLASWDVLQENPGNVGERHVVGVPLLDGPRFLRLRIASH